MRLYSLYSKPRGGRTWTRESLYSYPLATARQVWQSRLLDNALDFTKPELALRPVKSALPDNETSAVAA